MKSLWLQMENLTTKLEQIPEKLLLCCVFTSCLQTLLAMARPVSHFCVCSLDSKTSSVNSTLVFSRLHVIQMLLQNTPVPDFLFPTRLCVLLQNIPMFDKVNSHSAASLTLRTTSQR